jgi:hypothetical protein
LNKWNLTLFPLLSFRALAIIEKSKSQMFLLLSFLSLDTLPRSSGLLAAC